jgi:cholesterol oxidase
MSRLSSPIEIIEAHYDVVVIGSGYGASIAASRMARAGRRVCVLERGKEFQPGEYPDTEPEAIAEMQADLTDGRLGSRIGLYDLRVNPDINVFVGCGLGGTSLVNANVSLRAEPRVFEDSCWPQALRDDLHSSLEEGYRRAEEMLKPVSYPDNFPALAKLRALEKSAEHLRANCYRTPINVTFEDGVNHVGVEQHKCALCGDCVSGCNYSAKNTLIMNYLPDAKNHGAAIFTQVSVQRIERQDDRWLVYYQLLESGRESFDAPTLFVSADIVILGAGSLGSTEILLRSGQRGLSLSKQLGQHFTGNGDVLGFGYNNDEEINGIGFGHHPPAERDPVGPCITGIIDQREQADLETGMVIEEGSVPGALSAFLPVALSGAAKLVGKDTDRGVVDYLRETGREWISVIGGAYRGAARNTQTYLVMTHDDGNGQLHLENDRVRVRWPGLGAQPVFERVNERLKQATRPLGGTYVRNPLWHKVFNHRLVTVHPLGGCVMAEAAENGVVNHKGQVFADEHGSAVHDGLYVMDGAIVPRPLGVNPLLTISALAERCCLLLAQDRGWNIDYRLPSASQHEPTSLKLGLQFTETMRGYFSAKVKDDYRAAAQQGEQDNDRFEFTLTVISDDLELTLSTTEHKARMLGTVNAPSLSANPLVVTQGEFNLFVVDPARVGTRQMRYRMNLTADDGKTYFFDGFKVIHDEAGFDVWADTTTLYTTVYDGEDAAAPILGRGILQILPEDFLRQLTTLQVKNAKSAAQRLEATARFGRFFAGVLFETYGGIFAKPKVFKPDAPPRKRRPLRTTAPTMHFFKTEDEVQLRLIRYQGGNKGPVMLSHGLGVSSLIFSIDTIETNLLEYLFAHGYDVWLLDFRASIDLPASSSQFSGDDIATFDYPAAVACVRRLSGADSVQMVAHCFGSTTFFMAMLAGLEGVRSAVCSQIATHIVAPTATRVKAGLYLPSVLQALGVETMSAYVDSHADWREQLYDRALTLSPVSVEERCDSPVCHRITFMYAPLYEHDQLNEATHAALHEMFGVGNIRAFDHLATLVRTGHLVSVDGDENYLPHLDRLAIPITFIHGAENECFLPESTKITYNLLRDKNGKDLYARYLIPNYGHIDCIFGKNAARDVYPLILKHLEGIGA